VQHADVTLLTIVEGVDPKPSSVEELPAAARVLAVLTALTSWLISAPAASADSIDVVYFNGITAHGITASRLGVAFDLAAAVQLGHGICKDLRSGSTPIDEGMRVYETTNHRISQEQAYLWVGAAIGAYCPEQAANVHS
jgi:hypothetical protein